MTQKVVGLLSLQGSFAEHKALLKKLDQDFVSVRCRKDLETLTHLIIPGGESTTMTKLLKDSGMWDILAQRVKKGDLQVLGTCAGAILCAKLGMNIEIDRNAYGAQQKSFFVELESEMFPKLQGTFIRAPKITKIGKSACTLAKFEKNPVIVEEKNFLALTFHPELVGEVRIHEYFLKKQT